ncbi:ATP synthase subunit I [Psychromonas sp.]|uniref:ATP synthase subunit I n=1 Tax=Psychromonas sp. TaxID=1884585 RepID=UPI0039E28D23
MSSDGQWLKNVFVIFFGQLISLGLFSLFFYYTKDKTTGLSVILGGLVYCVPTLLASLFMSKASNKSAVLVVTKAYIGTLYKLIVSICLFIYVFKNIPINAGVFFTAYTITLATQYVMSCVLHKRN